MKRNLQTFIGVVCLGVPLALGAAPRPASSKNDIQFPAQPPVKVPDVQRVQLDNGLILHLIEDHSLPVMTLSATLRAGSCWDPAAKAGLASITGKVLRTGGTAAYPGDELDEQLDGLGAVIETSVGETSGSAVVSVLKEDAEKGVAILADLLQHPVFPEAKLQLAKIALHDAISRRNEDPSEIASREFRKLLLGTNSPYTIQAEHATVDAITRDDLVEFHKRFFQPENVILGVWGDFKSSELLATLRSTLGKWPKGGQSQPPFPETPSLNPVSKGLHFVSKEDINQSVVMIGHPAGRRDDPDYPAAMVMNYILGGGMSSRLFNTVRSEMGLAYSVGSGWGAGYNRNGVFSLSGGTKSGSTVEMVKAMLQEINRFASGGVTESELNAAKDAILKGMAFEFDSVGKVVERLVLLESKGYPRDYLQRYQDGVAKVTRADVAKAASTLIRPRDFAIIVVGNEKDFGKPLSELGTARKLDITIPGQPK